MLALLGWLVAACGSATGPMDTNRLFAVSKPATVIISAGVTAKVAVPDPAFTGELELLKTRANVQVATGAVAASDRVAWILDQIFADPLTYFEPSATIDNVDASSGWSGTGFIISSDGYIVTNAHVAAPSPEEVKSQIATNGLEQLVVATIKALVGALGTSGSVMDKARTQRAIGAFATYYAKNLKLASTPQLSLWVDLGATNAGVAAPSGDQAVQGRFVPGGVVGAKSIPVSGGAKAAGSPTPGKDVAVIKIDQGNLPTVQLGDDTQLNPGDRLFVMGYPGVADISEQTTIEPSLTTGTFSARKKVPQGFDVLQTDAAINHGNSGGPVFNSQGQVVGIATFGVLDQSTGAAAQGINFLMPMSVAKEFINQSGAKPDVGIVTQKYGHAVDLYNKGWYSDALAEFQTVNSLSPHEPYVQEYITKSQGAISQGKDRSYEKFLPFLIIGGIVLLLVAAGGVTLLVVSRRRPAVTPASWGQPMHPGGYAQPQAPQYSPEQQHPYQQYPPAPQYPEPQQAVPEAPATPAAQEPTAPAPSAFCPDCGNQVQGKAFCDRCGRQLNPSQAP